MNYLEPKNMANRKRIRTFLMRPYGWLIGGLFLIGGILVPFFVEGQAGKDRIEIITWRLPAELGYLRVQNKFSQLSKTLKPAEKEKYRKKEQRELQHIMDLHGFNKNDFWSFKQEAEDAVIKEKILANDPELYRKENISRLKHQIEILKNKDLEWVKGLQKNKEKTIGEFREEWKKYGFSGSEKLLKKMEALSPEDLEGIKIRSKATPGTMIEELPKLEAEEAKWNFPRPKDESNTFSQFQLKGWDLKEKFITQYLQLPTKSPTYFRSRWDLVQEFRTQLRDLMRKQRVQILYIDEFLQRNPDSLKKYVESHPEYSKSWDSLNDFLTKEVPNFSLENVQGMGMIVGTVVHCAVPPARCRGEAKANAKPLGGIPIKLVTEGDNLRKPEHFFFTTTSNAQGQYIIPAVPPGDYYLDAELMQQEQGSMYRGLARKFFVGSNHEVLILDLLVEKVAVTVRPVSPAVAAP